MAEETWVTGVKTPYLYRDYFAPPITIIGADSENTTWALQGKHHMIVIPSTFQVDKVMSYFMTIRSNSPGFLHRGSVLINNSQPTPVTLDHFQVVSIDESSDSVKFPVHTSWWPFKGDVRLKIADRVNGSVSPFLKCSMMIFETFSDFVTTSFCSINFPTLFEEPKFGKTQVTSFANSRSRATIQSFSGRSECPSFCLR